MSPIIPAPDAIISVQSICRFFNKVPRAMVLADLSHPHDAGLRAAAEPVRPLVAGLRRPLRA